MPLDPVLDVVTVTPDGERLAQMPHGVLFRDMTTYVDERGEPCEMFDPRWGWTHEDLVYAYMATIRAGWSVAQCAEITGADESRPPRLQGPGKVRRDGRRPEGLTAV